MKEKSPRQKLADEVKAMALLAVRAAEAAVDAAAERLQAARDVEAETHAKLDGSDEAARAWKAAKDAVERRAEEHKNLETRRDQAAAEVKAAEHAINLDKLETERRAADVAAAKRAIDELAEEAAVHAVELHLLRRKARNVAREQALHVAAVRELSAATGVLAVVPPIDDVEADVLFCSRLAAHARKQGAVLHQLRGLPDAREDVGGTVEERGRAAALEARVEDMHTRNTREFFAKDNTDE